MPECMCGCHDWTMWPEDQCNREVMHVGVEMVDGVFMCKYCRDAHHEEGY